jgi:hypothetical protein
MIEPLLLAARNDETQIKPSISYLLPFQDVIKAHFYHNGNATLVSVIGWINASRPTNQKAITSTTLDFLQNSLPELEAAIGKVCCPSLETKKIDATKGDSHLDTPMVSEQPKSNEDEPKSEIDRLRAAMEEAAQRGNFILAGQLQKEIQEIEEYENKIIYLKTKIEESAAKHDFVSAGEFQAQLHSTENNMKKRNTNSFNNQNHVITTNLNHESYHNTQDESSEDEMEEDEDDDYYDGYGMNSKQWGSGHHLGQKIGETVKKPAAQIKEDAAEAEILDTVQRLPVNDPCRLRIRLPQSNNNESLLEILDSSENLSVLYKCVKVHILATSESSNLTSPRLTQLRGFTNDHGNQAIGVSGGAFANPHSEYGFTLLTTHPKREFSLEMHGSISLKDLGMCPSATLTVMMCSSRGQVKRGILESKLGEAQGDAMDVEGLGYEALQELGEKMGIVKPGEGTWKGIDLEKVSRVTSPKEYLMQKSAEENDLRCPICLGSFDPTESETQLRTLLPCNHTFHSACLATWLSTKTNCPVCKCSL